MIKITMCICISLSELLVQWFSWVEGSFRGYQEKGELFIFTLIPSINNIMTEYVNTLSVIKCLGKKF